MKQSYFDLQQAVFDVLMQRHSQNEDFCFTLRKNYSKDTQQNYFTGTEKSSYFSFSLWYIKNSYPGASIDPLVYQITQRNDFLHVKLQLFQTKSPGDKQNRLVLELLQNIRSSFKEHLNPETYEIADNKSENAIYKISVRPHERITDTHSLISHLMQLINDTTYIIDAELNILKEANPEFDAYRVSKTDFEKMLKDRTNRIGKFRDELPSFQEIINGVIQLNNQETNPLFKFKEIHNTYVWVGDQSGLIGNKRAHYEIQFNKTKGSPDVVIHFEDAISHSIRKRLGEELSVPFKWYPWRSDEGIRIEESALSKEENIPLMLLEKLKLAETQFGNKLREILKDMQENPTDMKPLNQILYGPPGTGKTYSTIDKVVSICEPESYVERDHDSNKAVYDQLVKEGRVLFTTFHQSMAYEDFIEGIKPVKPGDEDKFLKYDVEPGIFSKIAKNAEKLIHVTNQSINWDNVRYFKMSVGGKNRPDIHDYCIKHNLVGLGWGGEEDLSDLSTLKDWISYRDAYKARFSETADENRYHVQASYILNRMNIGDIVVVTKGNHIIDAIGKVTGEYEFNDENPTGFYHFRKVEWIATDLNASPEKFFRKQISQQSIYEFYDEDIKRETFKELTTSQTSLVKPYALVIDEINRGNVSAIFGELITLIEEDKRKGKPNELSVTLPYSKESFSVPENLYLIGTMNTADRSVEALDTALRRRFSFVEMLPDPKLLSDKGTHGDGMIADINLPDLLTVINERIEVLVDRDHTIGHAFFINDKSPDDLKQTFKNKIIPLLQEYFYGNYQKMALVLGNSFFSIKEQKTVKFAEEAKDYDFSDQVYTIRDCADKDFDFLNAIRKLMNNPVQEDNKQPEEASKEQESGII